MYYTIAYILYIFHVICIPLYIYNISIIQCILITHVYSVYAYIIYDFFIYIRFLIYNFFKDFKHFSQILKEIQCNPSLSLSLSFY